MFYNLAGCPLKPRGTGSLTERLATIDDTGRRDMQRPPVQNLLGRIHDIEEHDRMTIWLHQRQLCRARRP
ncbi:hypothetical protein CBM2609_B130035 [Cupriavidus taiwanensis]|uniref:Uncharacterized protein n=1 Tax=Cupriavidus taiwanensis TaxID=164546 RepID=A0A375EB44_9BURK|nr:hypothetical protein CBM2604_B140033 [Cupriavidus taiwanensis]SOZ31485.1 hypothetical protein CBM2609_B130035 [Cupriavidus taiwanensis]SOZ47446.1 hypothetical protein CBM2610_B110033 [Cupriavidus taiwanensis]SOZ67315.1 hypothetical protein CBM2614_B210055 [Cupriavidus taiwanensis]SOZ68540.1 hypothetical protein CBM2615_B200055 [Cupriavidus taiwanensis]